MTTQRTILAALDGSSAAACAGRWAIALAGANAAEVLSAAGLTCAAIVILNALGALLGATIMSIQDKTWIAVGLAVITLFEFFSAMYVFGRKPTKERPKRHLKLFLRLHRVFG